MENRLFIVSNRLPLIIDKNETVVPASGGLVTAITSYLSLTKANSFKEVFWAGIPGCSSNCWTNAILNFSNSSYHYLPVFAPSKEYDSYYNGHSNSVLWPLFHYFPSYVEYDEESYGHYLKINERFADV